LLATHTAIRVARDVGYPEIPLDRVTCSNCGQELDWMHPDYGFSLTCPCCGTQTTLPCHLRTYAHPPPSRWEIPVLSRVLAWIIPEEPDYSSPRWLTILLVSCLVVVAIAIVTAIVKVGANQ
jgi:hypothetical protein